MNKKIVFGSIGAVFLLITISMFSVISARDTVETNETVTPLYKVRTDSAVQLEESIAIEADYVGEGAEETIYLPEYLISQTIIAEYMEQIVQVLEERDEVALLKIQEDLLQNTELIEAINQYGDELDINPPDSSHILVCLFYWFGKFLENHTILVCP